MSYTASTGRSELAIGIGCALTVVCIWTTFLLFSRYSMQGTLTPFDLTAMRFGISGIVLLPILLRRGMAGLRLWQAMVLVATAGLGFSTFVYWGFTLAPAAHGSILLPGVLPLWTAILVWIVMKERPRGFRLLGLASITAGVVALLTSAIRNDPQALPGDAMFASASFCWAIFTVAATRWKVPPLTATAIVTVGSAGIFLPIYVLFLPKALAATPVLELSAQIVFQGIVVTVVALWAYTRANAILGSAVLTMLLSIVPTTSALLAIPLLGEPIAPANGVGLALVSIGMICAVVSLTARSRAVPAAAPARAGSR